MGRKGWVETVEMGAPAEPQPLQRMDDQFAALVVLSRSPRPRGGDYIGSFDVLGWDGQVKAIYDARLALDGSSAWYHMKWPRAVFFAQYEEVE